MYLAYSLVGRSSSSLSLSYSRKSFGAYVGGVDGSRVDDNVIKVVNSLYFVS